MCRRTLLSLALAATMTGALVEPAGAAVLTVCASGPPTCGYATIQAAVAAAATNDQVQVAAGTWNESVVVAKRVDVDGPWTRTDVMPGAPAVAAAVVRGDGSGAPAFAISGGGRVSGFEVTGVLGGPAVVLDGEASIGASWIHHNTAGVRMTGVVGSTDTTVATGVSQSLVEANNEPGPGSGIGIDSSTTRGSVLVAVRDHGVAGIRVRSSASANSFSFRGNISGSPTGIDASGPGRLMSWGSHVGVPGAKIDVPAGGTGIKVAGGTVSLSRTVVQASAAATGTVGVDLDGATQSTWLFALDLLDLDVAVRYGAAFSDSTNPVVDAVRIRSTGRDAAIVNDSAETVTVSRSHVGCVAAPCPALARGAGAVVESEPARIEFLFDGAHSPTTPDLIVGQAHKVDLRWSSPPGMFPVSPGASAAYVTLSSAAATPASGVVAVDGGEVEFRPAAAGTPVTLIASLDGRDHASVTMPSFEPPAALEQRPRVRGVPEVGRVLSCTSATWSVPPTATVVDWYAASSWSSARRVGTGRTYRVRIADADKQLYCRVRASWPNRRDAIERSAGVKARLRIRRVMIVPVSPRGRAVACGRTLRAPCKLRRGDLLRFAIAATPVQQAGATWVIEARRGRAWRATTSGKHRLPSRYYLALGTDGAPLTTYRVRARMGRLGPIARGVSPWRYWKLHP